MHHRGFTKLEMLVSASLLTTMIAIATPLFSQLNQAWHSTRLFQIASQELMNQMDGLMQLSSDECRTAVSDLKVSPELLAVIPDARLTGKMESSSDGQRVVLFFQLPTSVRSEPIVLVGWLNGGVDQ
ncbi:MAG: hypothetical protein NTY15_09250 [Planctomycetota bacterium]|jgi:competence protein ComGC|nr:hypothetical protein [Planctomycetota bacterium]